MADVEVVIKIPKEVYDRFGYEYREENCISKYTNDIILDAFCKGTLLPKGHGRLIDADELKKIIQENDVLNMTGFNVRLCDINNASTIIEADKEESEEQTE